MVEIGLRCSCIKKTWDFSAEKDLYSLIIDLHKLYNIFTKCFITLSNNNDDYIHYKIVKFYSAKPKINTLSLLTPSQTVNSLDNLVYYMSEKKLIKYLQPPRAATVGNSST